MGCMQRGGRKESLPISGSWNLNWYDLALDTSNEPGANTFCVLGSGTFHPNGQLEVTLNHDSGYVIDSESKTHYLIWETNGSHLILTNAKSNIAMVYQIVKRKKRQWICDGIDGIQLELTKN